jgi:hypothetical protein
MLPDHSTGGRERQHGGGESGGRPAALPVRRALPYGSRELKAEADMTDGPTQNGSEPGRISILGPLHLIAGVVFLAAGLWLAWTAADGMPLERLTPILVGALALISLVDGIAYVLGRRARTASRAAVTAPEATDPAGRRRGRRAR